MARILIVEDHGTSARGLAATLRDSSHDVTIVQLVDEVAKALDKNPPFDLAFVDLIFDKQRFSGLDALDTLTSKAPETRLALFTTPESSRQHHIEEALIAFNIVGGIPKDASEAVILSCSDALLSGQEYFDIEIEVFRPEDESTSAALLLHPESQAKIWVALARGVTRHDQIATEMSIPQKTVQNAIGQMCEKLIALGALDEGDRSTAALAHYAGEHQRFFLGWWEKRIRKNVSRE